MALAQDSYINLLRRDRRNYINLNSFKNRNKITDVSIEKIPQILYKGLNESQNMAIYTLVKRALQISQMENNGDEVAITCALEGENSMDVVGIALGEEHSVDVCADTISKSLLMTGIPCAVVVMHNYPTTQTLSLEDIHFFLSYPSVKMMVVVNQQGKVHYICKDESFSYEAARYLYNECTVGLTGRTLIKDIYFSGLSFLVRCSEAGLFYC